MQNNSHNYDLVIGLGEIGRPLLEIIEESYVTCGRDINYIELQGQVRILHVCYPYEIGDFIDTTVQYLEEYNPELVLIHSTIVPGTARKIFERTGIPMAYSPVRGKHTRMRQDLLKYTKFVAGTTQKVTERAVDYLKDAGFKVRSVSSCETLELAKLMETTYFGLLIAWSQEVERFCDVLEVDYDEVMEFTKEVSYLPPVIFRPGYIGGHCVIPNSYLIEHVRTSPFIDAIQKSNELKKEQWLKEGRDLSERIKPKPVQARSEQVLNV